MKKYPIVYHPRYRLGNKWLKHIHPLDMDKFGDCYRALLKKKLFMAQQIYTPLIVTKDQIRLHHNNDYIHNKIQNKNWVADVFQISSIKYVPYSLTNHLLIKPIFYHTGGTILAAQLACEYGWAINLGGGAHHAHAANSSGFCLMADISISIKQLRRKNPKIKKVMIIDLDAHQGNGHERDFASDPNTYILDMYGYGALPDKKMFYPDDKAAMAGINCDVKLDFGTTDDEYLEKLTTALKTSEKEFSPDLIYYIAGADILEGDARGMQSVSETGMIERDEMVFGFARKIGAPIVSLQAGGYQDNLGLTIADSIENLHNKFDLFG